MKRRIINMDQTPAPFEYLDGQTYELKDAKTIQANATKSGWDKPGTRPTLNCPGGREGHSVAVLPGWAPGASSR
jgi:hypothetical protein